MLKIRPNGNVIVDELVTDVNVDGLKSIKTIKCPNLYGTAFEVWESQDLATIFGTGEVLEPEGVTTFTATSGHNYYDTYTGTITVGADNVVTITNPGETAVTVYVVDLTTLFTTEPNETQMDDMYKMFTWAGTGSELITLESVWYIDYSAEVIHNLTTIYGAGNEPTLSTHESLIPQYTNTVLKAKAFADTLQQEYMQISLDTAIYEGLSLRDIYEDGRTIPALENLVMNGDFSDGITGWTATDYILSSGRLYLDSTIDGLANLQQMLSFNANDVYYFVFDLDLIVKGTSKDYGLFLGLATQRIVNFGELSIGNQKIKLGIIPTASRDRIYFNAVLGSQYYIDNIMAFNLTASHGVTATSGTAYDNAVADIELALAVNNGYIDEWGIGDKPFTVRPSQLQLDEWLDMYLTLKGSTTNTGTEFYQDRYYVDYDNAKVYDYNIIAAYVPETPADKEAYMAQLVAKTVTLTAIPVKAKIYKDRFVILGSFVEIGQ